MAKEKYALELRPGVSGAQFNADGKEIELTEQSPRFETDDPLVYREARQHPFLKDAAKAEK